MRSLRAGKLSGPLCGNLESVVFVFDPGTCDLFVEGVVWVGCGEEGLDGEEDGADLEGRRPPVFQHVEADPADLVDVGVVDLGKEPDLGRSHRVLLGQKQLQVEDPALVCRRRRPCNHHPKVPQVVLVRRRRDPRRGRRKQFLSLL